MLKVEQLDRVVAMSKGFNPEDEEPEGTAVALLQAMAVVALAEQMYNVASQLDRLAGHVFTLVQKK